MNTELNIFSLFDGMEWPASKQDILEYATDNGFIDDIFDIINDIEVEEDYYFSSINDLVGSIGNVFVDKDEISDDFSGESFSEENFGENEPLE